MISQRSPRFASDAIHGRFRRHACLLRVVVANRTGQVERDDFPVVLFRFVSCGKMEMGTSVVHSLSLKDEKNYCT